MGSFGSYVVLNCNWANASDVLDGIKIITSSQVIPGLYLQSYNIEELPNGVFDNVSLKILTLRTPKLRIIQADALGKKSELSIRHFAVLVSKLSEIPRNIFHAQLQTLIFQNSTLETLSEICKGMECAQTLIQISFAGNKINRIENGAFKSLKNLTDLDLSQNKLKSVSGDIFGNKLEKMGALYLM